MASTPMPVIMLGVSHWRRFSLPQGVQFDGTHYFVSQAWATGVGPAEDTIIHRYTATGVYRDCMRLPNAGHCSAFGVRKIDANRTNIYVGWNQINAKGVTLKRPVVRVLYRPGTVKFGDDETAVYPISGQPAVDPKSMRIATRTVGALAETFRVYDLAALNTGKVVKLAEFKVKRPIRPGQGFTLFGDKLWRQYGRTGGKSVIWEHTWATGKQTRAGVDTTHYVPSGEPEGVFIKDGKLHFCKRLGGVNANRRLYIFKAPA